ncbi:MAG: L-methionine gamma-lyase [Planctomycetes bacterium]|nr:L-methionine gamma-lyase [Planctomycetota bacterium]
MPRRRRTVKASRKAPRGPRAAPSRMRGRRTPARPPVRHPDGFLGGDPAGRALDPATLMMSYGYHPEWSEGALKCPIFQTSTFVFRTADEGKRHFAVAYGLRKGRKGAAPGLIYSRLNNPDLEILEDRLTLWDEAEAGAVFESGMAAISTTLLEFVRPGDVVLASDPVYGGTDHLLAHVLPRFGVSRVRFPAGCDAAEIEHAVDAAKARGRVAAVLVETPANPTNALVDIAALRGIAGRCAPEGRAAPVIVDNTLLGPLWQQPLRHGADLVVYSATKFLGGHSDVIAGAVVGRGDLVGRVKGMRTFLGTMAGPWTAWLLMRSLETLQLRMTRAAENARHVADFLAAHPRVAKVHYLGHLREGDPQHDLWRRQCSGAGSIISFEVKGGEREAFRVLDALSIVHLAVSLGGTESLASHPATMTHADIPAEDQRRAGITSGLIRLSVGVEDAGDLVADLGRALGSRPPRRSRARRPG